MPPHYQVPMLFDLVGDRVWKWLLRTAISISNPVKAKQLRVFVINNLNSVIRQHILNKVMNTHMYEYSQSKKSIILELFADKSIKTLDLTQKPGFNILFIDEVFELYRVIVMANLTQLETLCVICSIKANREEIYISDVNSIFFKGLKQMDQLRTVTVTAIADTEFMEILGKNCIHLQHLDVSGSVRITDESIVCLLIRNNQQILSSSDHQLRLTDVVRIEWEKHPCCSLLSYLGISETEVSNLGVTLALFSLPRLYSFGGHVGDDSFSKCLHYLLIAQPTKLFALKYLWDAVPSISEAACIQSCCPNLIALETESIVAIHCFTNLNSLTIDADLRNVENDLLDLVYVIGNSLTSLILKNSLNTRVDLKSLAECIPSIQNLEMPLHCDELSENLDCILPYLSTANVSLNSANCLQHLLLISPSLTYLKLRFSADHYCETSDSINDSLLISVLGDGALRNLQHLSLEDCALGDEGLISLIHSCPKLNYVEKLFYWKNLTKSFVEEMEKKISANNWDLRLVIKEKWGDMKL